MTPASSRLLALALLTAAGCVNYIDRSALAIANAPIRASLGLSRSEMGLLLSAFAWAYGFSQIPVGMLVDRYGPKRLLTLGLCIWSAAQTCAAASGSLGFFLVARLALGVGESPLYLAGTKVCTAWWEKRRRSLPIGIFNASSALGPAIAPPILTALILGFGWRSAFVVAGGLGLLVAAAWQLLYRDPPPGVVDTAGDDEPAAAAPTAADLRALLGTRLGWILASGFFGIIYLTWLYGAWFPDYLHSAMHLSLRQVGTWAAVPQFSGFAGALLGGVVSDLLARRGVSPVAASTRPLLAGLVLAAAATLGLATCRTAAPAVALASLALFCAYLASSCGWAVAAVAIERNRVATLQAIQNVGGSLGGATAPLVTGVLIQWSGSFESALVTGAAVALLSAGIYGVGLRSR